LSNRDQVGDTFFEDVMILNLRPGTHASLFWQGRSRT
jgi:hypothetical protein